METQVPNALSQATAENALKRIAGTSAYSSGVYVLGQNRRLVGWVSVDTLLRAERTTPVGDLMEHDVPRLGANTVLDTALGDSGWELSDVLPVIDREARLVGAIRYIDLRRAWLQAMHREGIDQRLDTLMDAMNHPYIGMAEIMDASIARRTVGGASRHEEPRR